MPKGDLVGEFELYILLAITHLGTEAYGLAIQRAIVDRTGRDTAIGAVYATLGRLRDKGWIDFRISDPEPIPGGRARKCFRLTVAGDRALSQSTSMLARMLDGWTPRPRRT